MIADAIAQTSPAPAQAPTSSAGSASPDKKWEYVTGDDQPKLLKTDTKEGVLDLGEQGLGSVLWAPDSKRFALISGAEKHQSSLLLMIAVRAGTFAWLLARPTHRSCQT
jgi:hypothetical protein